MNQFVRINTFKLHLCHAVLLISSTLLVGCSSVSHFIIENHSDSLLKITYVPPAGFFALSGEQYDECFEDGDGSAYRPSVAPFYERGRSPQEWSDLAPEEYVCDFEAHSVSFRLAPGFAAVLAHVANYIEDSPGNYGSGISMLTLESNQETTSYEGELLKDVFHDGKEPAWNARYVLRYE